MTNKFFQIGVNKKYLMNLINFKNNLIHKFQKLKIKYKLTDNNLDCKCLRNCDFMFNKISIPKEYKKLQEHFDKLKNLPQPAQRSKEWYDYRYNRITASDAAAGIDLNPYEPVESFILKKSVGSLKQ